ncbi:MAG: hypothetical protein AABX35_01220 [Nanoarchaeota archaeon]
MAKQTVSLIGSWAFLIGVILAIVFGLVGITPGVLTALAVIGLIVGLLNVGSREVTPFLMSGTVLIIASFFGQSIMNSVPYIDGVLSALSAIFVPATIIVAIKNVFSIASS